MAETTRRSGGRTSTARTRGSSQRARGQSAAPARPARSAGEHDGSAGHGAVTVPVLVPEVHVHHVPVPTGAHVPVPHVPLPHLSRGSVLWLGGLAALAATGAIGWPVAAVVAAGTYVAERRAREDVRRELEEQRGADVRKA